MLKTKEEAYKLLESLGASRRLLVHVKLVGEAAEELLAKFQSLGINLNADFVRLGVAIHDAGKILHPNELEMKGNQHEPSGEELLLEAGVKPSIARCALSHARYDSMDVSFEELVIALSDNLWKGKRAKNLELRVIDAAAEAMVKTRWEIFIELDECFEKIASQGESRLTRSVVL